MRRVDGAPLPTGLAVPTYKVLRPQKDGRLDLIILGERLHGVDVHFVWPKGEPAGRSHPCTYHETGVCLYHRHRKEWNGFVAVWWITEDKPAVLRVAPEEAGVLLAALGKEGAWSGVRLSITPTVTQRGKRIRVDLATVQPTRRKYVVHDVGPTLCALFGVDRLPVQIGGAAEAAGPVPGIDDYIPLPPEGGAS